MAGAASRRRLSDSFVERIIATGSRRSRAPPRTCAQEHKARITLRQVLSHTAGLPVLDEPIQRDELGDLDRLAGVLARQRPVWEPGTRHGYGAFTVGFYPAEVLRRVDGRTLGAFVAEEISRQSVA